MAKVIDKTRATIIKRGRVALEELGMSSITKADRARLDRVLRAMLALDDEQAEAYSVIETAHEQLLEGDRNSAMVLLEDSAHSHKNQVANGGEERIVCAMGRFCSLHGFIHGGEAEELRKKLEKLLENGAEGKVSRATLMRLLDDVDARDSCAFLEGKEKRAKKLVKRGG